MNFFKSLAFTAVVAASSITTVEAQPAGQQALFKALDRAGVTYSKGACAEHGIEDTYGFFVPAKNHIHICDDVATTEEQVFETLRHEAVHAAQRCVNPSMAFTVHSSQYLLSNGLQSDWSFIQRAYDQKDWAIELEAFTLMRRESDSLKLLRPTARLHGGPVAIG